MKKGKVNFKERVIAMTIEERLEKLEMELAKMKNEVRSKQFILIDDQGNTRAQLLWDGGQTKLTIFDKDEMLRASLLVDGDRAMLYLNDKDENSRVVLDVEKNAPELTMYDENGKVILSIPGLRPKDVNFKVEIV